MIVIEPLTADRIESTARIHRTAFPDSLITALGPEAARRYYRWLLQGPHDSVGIAALDDGELAGFLVGGRFQGAVSGYMRANRPFLIGRMLLRPWLIARPDFFRKVSWRTLKRTFRRSAPPSGLNSTLNSTSKPRRSFGVLSIAVDPARQGRGVGAALMIEAERQAREQGYDAMDLTVAPTNAAAVRLYEKLGWSRETPADGVWTGTMRKALS